MAKTTISTFTGLLLNFICFFLLIPTHAVIIYVLLLILVSVILLLFVFDRGRVLSFINDWSFPLSLFLVYLVLRSYADDTFIIQYTGQLIYQFEKASGILLFTSKYINYIEDRLYIVYLFRIIYFSYFGFTFLLAIFIWFKDRIIFKKFIKGFLLINYISLIFFYVLPTTPPWLINNTLTDLHGRQLLGFLENDKGNLVNGIISSNYHSAFPSLHFAWTLYGALVLYSLFGKRFLILLAYPLLMGLALIYGYEHYFTDFIPSVIISFSIYKPLFSRQNR